MNDQPTEFYQRVREAVADVLECDCLAEYATSGQHLTDCYADRIDDIVTAVNTVFGEFIVESLQQWVTGLLWTDE